jgi:hypothetical protein
LFSINEYRLERKEIQTTQNQKNSSGNPSSITIFFLKQQMVKIIQVLPENTGKKI